MRSRADTIERVLIAGAVGLVALTARAFPETMELGSLLAVAALALLGQGLLRDLWLLAQPRRRASNEPALEVSCLCMESTLGLSVVVVGVVLTATGISLPVHLPGWVWPLVAAVVWFGGYTINDVVIHWSPWKLRRVKDHGSLIVRWRTTSHQ
jgi:hypothetical protein